MATVNLSWTNPSASSGGTPEGYYIYRANGDVTPSVSNGAFSNMTKLSGTVSHTSAGASNSGVDNTAQSGSTYTYAVVAFNEAGEGITSAVPHDTVTA
jgi:hypothetical protein